MIKWEQKEPFDKLDFKDYEIMNWLKRSASQTPNKWATKSSVQNYWCKIYIIFTPQQCWVVLKNMKKVVEGVKVRAPKWVNNYGW
jgi:hypothetical protein